MKWLTRNDVHLSAPYRLYRSVRGWEAWIWAKGGGACLGRELALPAAKALCEAHRERSSSTSSLPKTAKRSA